MLSNHLFLCLLLLLPLIFPWIRVFSNVSALYLTGPKYWSFSISPSNEYSGLISFGFDWFDLLAVQGTLKSLPQQHNLKASILPHSAFFVTQKLHSAKLWKVTHKAVLCQVAYKSKWLEMTQMLVGRGPNHGTSVHGMGGSSKQTRMLLKPHMRTTRWRKEGRTHISKWVQITWVPLSQDCPGQNSPVMGRLSAKWACTLLSSVCCLQLLPPFSGCSTSSVWFVYENKTSEDELLAFIPQKATVPDFLTFIETPSVHQQHAINRYWKK